jgi:HAD superfamily hydrolase (TIGR01662 family)
MITSSRVSTARFDAVLFDWDDTLCGAEPHRFAFAREVASYFGVELSLAHVYRAFVRAGDSAAYPRSSAAPGQSFTERMAAELGIDPDLRSSFIHAYLRRDVYKRFELFDDVLDMIDRLGQRALRVGVISNNDEVAHYIERLDVQHRFEIVVSPSTWGIAKPDPEIFRRALHEMDVEPERAIYVGDSYDNDVIGARAAGMTPVLIDRFGINLTGHDAEHRVETLAALEEVLDRLLG